jgi:hypothetical protein
MALGGVDAFGPWAHSRALEWQRTRSTWNQDCLDLAPDSEISTFWSLISRDVAEIEVEMELRCKCAPTTLAEI